MKTIISSQRTSLSFDYENQRELMKEERFAGKQNSAGEMGHRIAKHSYDKDQAYNNGLGQLVKSTYYVLDAQGNTMATYERSIDNGQTSLTYTQTEKFIYGSARLGVQNVNIGLLGSQNNTYTQTTVVHRIGKKGYELSNHLGNVLSVISDKVIPNNNGGGVVDYFLADIRQAQDFSPFGVLLQNRNLSLSGAIPYRYLYQGQEMDDEVKGEGNSVNYKFRMHDPRLGRFFAIDPLANDYPFYSPYSFSGNIVINAIELEGLEPIYVAGTTQDIPRPTKPLLVSSTQREIEFAITNLFTALAIGLANGSTNISSNSSRFATRGVDAKSGSILNLNLSLRDKKNPKGIDQGGQIGAFRHVLWQSTIRNEFGYKIAKQVGDAHENNPNVDLNKRNFKSNEIALADQTTDLLNNQIGREIGRLNPDATTNELAQATATYFYEKGFYTFNKDKDGNITIVRSKITRKQYELLIARFKELNNNGETLGESTLREQNSKDKLVK